MPTSTVENYIKQLYLEQQRAPGSLVSLGKLAAAMGVVPGTVTTMVRTLADAGLVQYEPRTGASLTPAGDKLALHVLRRHRLVELHGYGHESRVHPGHEPESARDAGSAQTVALACEGYVDVATRDAVHVHRGVAEPDFPAEQDAHADEV